MRKFLFAISAVMALAGAISVHARGEYKYIFVPLSTSDGSPTSDWGGALFLDAPMSAGGSVSDINQSESVLKTIYGSFDLASSSDVGIGTKIIGGFRVPVPFTWNASTITSMDITGFGPLKDAEGSVYGWQITQSSIEIGLTDPTAFGSWVASVPDTASTALLIGLAAAGLVGFGHFSRMRQLSMARR
jgi:hypothetical protein